MVNHKMKALVLIMCTVLMLTGCGENSDSSNQNDRSSNDNSSQAAETVTVKMYVPGSTTPIVSGIQKDPVAKEIERVTGVIMDMEISTNADKIKVMAASGDLPDLTMISPDMVGPLIQAGELLDLSPYLDQAPNLQKNAAMALQYSRDVFSGGEDAVYVLPARAKQEKSPIATSQYGNFLRWDYYKELGLPAINNEDDLIQVVKDMVANHPTTADGKKVYGFSTFADWGMWGYHFSTFYSKYSGLNTFGPFDNYYNESREYVPILDDRALLWKSSSLYNKAYREGLLDPESFTQNSSNFGQKVDEGQIMAVNAEWFISSINARLADSTNGLAAYQDIPLADTEEYSAWYDRSVPFGFSSRSYVVSSKTKHPEAVIRLLDYLYSEEGARTVFTGVQDVIWSESNGEYQVKPEAIDQINANPDYRTQQAIHKYENIVGLDYDSLGENGQSLDLFLEPDVVKESYTAADEEYMKHYGADSKLGVIEMRKFKNSVNQGIDSLIPIANADQKRTETKINDYIMTAIPTLIMSKDQAAYDQKKAEIIEKLKALGVESVSAFYQDGFEKAIETLEGYN
ncbi:extracellular solute-binding protein [Paenibacillus daejeonensis]|uniref:extracellular solute-binding protein n=1 Tax=Paenibacillus daejeonensis TaxID=135193 RepID=UPI0003653AC3|nr:extracellular solute-binding protein [Paenibacillus daejeonensis]